MAKRYSGQVVLTITYRDGSDDYKATIVTPAGRSTQYVGRPAYIEHAVDSPKSYDNVARAAMSFAEHDGFDVGDYASFSGSGYHVGRSKAQAWSKEQKSTHAKAAGYIDRVLGELKKLE